MDKDITNISELAFISDFKTAKQPVIVRGYVDPSRKTPEQINADLLRKRAERKLVKA